MLLDVSLPCSAESTVHRCVYTVPYVQQLALCAYGCRINLCEAPPVVNMLKLHKVATMPILPPRGVPAVFSSAMTGALANVAMQLPKLSICNQWQVSATETAVP